MNAVKFMLLGILLAVLGSFACLAGSNSGWVVVGFLVILAGVGAFVLGFRRED